ncbi:DUF6252 family protein [Flavobacterium sp. Fl-318]|uniref:DUF6252 family protein n=1 Tax=Flavobacterium cupriresistens TaxID=2893885 RepID=A0ABU4RGP0_9FLAO|nr:MULTISPECIES: DUF6252 family protein [unclassified Flavobacterium]MDX6189691.1 DUF6252 family protein [Flavobacterium sp. Fl-318]UFH40903.1 DUF6252 family protein [Flavobacterium sp. F-323]
MKKRLGLVVLLVAALFTGCSGDADDKKEDQAGIASVTAAINGVAWKATKINSVTLMKVPGENGGQRFDINAEDGSQRLFLTCGGELTADDAMPLKEYVFEDSGSEGELININALFLNYYLIGGDSFVEHTPKSGKMTITAMNPEKKTVSGTFSFTNEKGGILQTKIVTPDVFEVTNGVFTDLSYTVIKGE